MSDEVISNRDTGRWLRLQADLRNDDVATAPAPAEPFESLRFGPRSTVAQIAAQCARHSTPERPIVARIECINGQPVAYLCRDEAGFVPDFLRRGSDGP